MAKKEVKSVHEVTVKIEGDSWEKALDKVFKEKQKTVKVDGLNVVYRECGNNQQGSKGCNL